MSNKIPQLPLGLARSGNLSSMRPFQAVSYNVGLHSAIAHYRPHLSNSQAAFPRRYKSDHTKKNLSVLEQQRLRRPVSPHLTIYRWRYQSLVSILQRFSGIFLSGGLYVFATGYLLAPLIFPDTAALAHVFNIDTIAAAVAELPGWLKALAKFVVALPFTFHAFNGAKQLVFDSVHGLTSRPGIVRASRIVAGLSLMSALGLALI